MEPLKTLTAGKLKAEVYNNSGNMGIAAAAYVTKKINETMAEKGFVNLILATGASQFTMLAALKEEKSINWGNINVFHLDEYLGISDQHPASFRKYLAERILNEVRPKEVNYLNGDAPDPEAEIKRYEELLKLHPVDIACIGIGENGHIAFNDPPVADFNDPKLVKIVELDEACRKQQLGEGWFPTFNDVPTHAMSLTVTAIINCKAICCSVPDERKAEAVYDTINAPISTDCPATILRQHPETILFLDAPSAGKLSE